MFITVIRGLHPLQILPPKKKKDERKIGFIFHYLLEVSFYFSYSFLTFFFSVGELQPILVYHIRLGTSGRSSSLTV